MKCLGLAWGNPQKDFLTTNLDTLITKYLICPIFGFEVTISSDFAVYLKLVYVV